MKRLLSVLSAIYVCICIYADYFPVSLPDVGNGRLVVCGQNANNYFVVNLDAERPKYHDIAGLEDKTEKIVKTFRYVDADIYAICELEANDSVLAYLTNAMNQAAGQQIYAYVKDGLKGDDEQIKSGFMYRKDKVKPFGISGTTSTQMYYNYTMRYQTFEELSTGERFVLSMNHFKAKDNTADQGNAKRERNAQDLVNSLSRISVDSDILVLGDLNSLIDESPLVYITNAGYIEEILKYDPDAYSHYYSGYQLIDHVFSNTTMSQQITGAGVFNINTRTKWSSSYKFSDHDPCIVGINLSSGGKTDPQPQECESINFTQDFKQGLDQWENVQIAGSSGWYYNNYGAIANAYKGTKPAEMWLISPTFDLTDMQSATISLRHNLYIDNSNGKYPEYQTLWVSNDYQQGDSPTNATWTQIPITYTIKSYSDCTVQVPTENLKDNFHYAFKYLAPQEGDANMWEIDNTALTATCKNTTRIEDTYVDIHDTNTRIYSIMGNDVTALRDRLPRGVYLLVNGTKTKKIVVNQ